MKRIILILLLSLTMNAAFSFSTGSHLSLSGTFGGSFSNPQLTKQVLNDLNPLATSMTGIMSSMLVGGDLEYSYLWYDNGKNWLKNSGVFDGIGISINLGAEQGSAGQKVNARVSDDGAEFDIFMIVDYNPVLALGGSFDLYFFDCLRLKLGGGTRIIADMNPEYLLYTTLDDETAYDLDLQQQVGTIIVTEDMISKMNAFMSYARVDLDYYVPMTETITFSFGVYGRYDWFRPMYLTMPKNMYDMVIENGGNPDKKQPDYWLNSIDFGITAGISIAIGQNNPHKLKNRK